LGVVGTADTLAALGIGQVDELLITATPASLDEEAVLEASTVVHAVSPAKPDGELPDETAKEITADALVTAAKQTGAKVTFIEESALLAEVGGVGALLRYKV
jgi:peptide subunit release factor 1 (eRF1)